MSKKVKVWIEQPAVKAGILCSSEMRALISGKTAEIARDAGAGYTFTVAQEKTRIAGRVYAGNDAAAEDNSDNNTLLRYV